MEAEALLAGIFTHYVDAALPVPTYLRRHPWAAARGVLALLRLPSVDAELPPVREAAALRNILLEHPRSRRMLLGVSAVLTLPTEPGAYVEGPERATVRRKIRSAEKHSLAVRPVRDDEKAHLLALADEHEITNCRAAYRVEAPDNDDLLDYALWLVAVDGDGRPIMLSVTPTAGEWSALRYFRTLVPGPASSDARYLMARELAEALRARGVRYLVDSARPHWLPNGLRHFQRIIGFRLIRLRRVRVIGR